VLSQAARIRRLGVLEGDTWQMHVLFYYNHMVMAMCFLMPQGYGGYECLRVTLGKCMC